MVTNITAINEASLILVNSSRKYELALTDSTLVKVKVKLRFSAPSAGIAEIEQT